CSRSNSSESISFMVVSWSGGGAGLRLRPVGTRRRTSGDIYGDITWTTDRRAVEGTAMSATRLLVLGTVRIFGTAHGYLVHNELTTWGADEWANVKWGSIYHALRQMATKGLLDSTVTDDHLGRVDYTITPAGDEEFFRLLRSALKTPE